MVVMIDAETRSVFGGITDQLTGAHQRAATAQAELAQVTQERDIAMAAAAKPFAGPIDSAKAEIRQAEALLDIDEVVQSVRELFPVDSVQATALALLLERSQIGVTGFAEYLVETVQSVDARRHGSRVHADMDYFMGLYHTLELAGEDGAPVAAFGLSWYENIDPQAEHEGRPAGTDMWHKQCSGYFGRASLGDLRVVSENIAQLDALLPVFKPKAVHLQIGAGAIELVTELGWGCLQSTHRASVKPVSVTLIASQLSIQPLSSLTLHRQNGPDLVRSDARDWSLMERRGLTQQLMRGEPRYFVVVGREAVVDCVEGLSVDEALPDTTRCQLQEIKEAISIDK